MIVQEPPYDLIALFADLEMQKFFEALIERGQEPARRCIHTVRWRSLRDPRRDTVWREPERALAPFLKMDVRFLIVWDHHGSGFETAPANEIALKTIQRLKSRGLAEENVFAIAIDPELECLFYPVWDRVKRIISSERSLKPPTDEMLLESARKAHPRTITTESAEAALRANPKEIFDALVVTHTRLRRAAPLYRKIGAEVSLPAVKRRSPAEGIVGALRTWFPWVENSGP